MPRVLIRHYGSELNGATTSISHFLSIFTLVEAGISSASVFALYKPLANHDTIGINRILSAAQKCYSRAGLAFTVLAIFLSISYPFFIQIQALSHWELSILALILSCSSAVEFFTLARIRILLQAAQRSHVSSLAQSIALPIQTALIALLAHFDASILIVRAVALSSVAFRLVFLHRYARRTFPELQFDPTAPASLISQRWDALYLQLLGAIQKSAPVLILTFFLDDLRWLSVFALYALCLQGITSVLEAAQSGLMSAFGELLVKGENEKFSTSYRLFEFAFQGLNCILHVTCAITLLPFMQIYTRGITDMDYQQPLLAFLMTLNGLFYHMKSPHGLLVFSAGLYHETRVQTTIQGAILLIVGLILTPWLGVIGPIIGGILSNIYRTIELKGFMPKHLPPKSFTQSGALMLCSIVLFSCIYLILQKISFSASNYLIWSIEAAGVCCAAAGLWCIVSAFKHRDEMKALWTRFRNIRSH